MSRWVLSRTTSGILKWAKGTTALLDEPWEALIGQSRQVHVVKLVCMVAGGPCKYTGKGMKEAHANLHMTTNEWQALPVAGVNC